MKFQTLAFAGVALTAAVEKQSVSDKSIVETILDSPWLLPRTLHKSLTHHLGGMMKRQVPVPMASTPIPKNAPKSLVPQVQELKAEAWEGAQRVKIRYGPYRIPPISEKNFQSMVMNVQGMTDTFDLNAKKPCEGDCTIMALFADLEFADGSRASNANGTWFHHAVLLNSGPNVIEANCGMGKVENMFMSGNERTTGGFALPESNIKSGYSINAQNKFILTNELMNMKDQEQWVWMALTYEFLPGHHPDFKQGKTIWMSIGPLPSCPGTGVKAKWGPSNLTISQQPRSKVFAEHSVFWQAPRDGYILGTGGHQHDGGTGTLVFKNDDVICDSQPVYGAAGGHGGMGGMEKRQLKGTGYKNSEIAHILKQKPCNFKDGIAIKKGDTMHIQANYDFNTHPGMLNKKGELDEVMGIVGTLVAF